MLTVNHVVDIILHYLEHRDWSRAVASAVPDRKKVAAHHAQDSEEMGQEDRQGGEWDHAKHKREDEAKAGQELHRTEPPCEKKARTE